MWYGWTGTELEIDLSRANIKKNQGNQAMYHNYLGGRGLITRLFWDRVPPETEPFSAENLLIFGAGTLVGTAVPGANRTTMVTKSPLTGYLTYSNMGGFWGPELKFAGYDTLSVSGKSPSPVYIYVNNDKVEIRDARHLWGKSVAETQRMIRAELKNECIQVMCIGPAGENKVLFASIEHSYGFSFSRTGVGAIMGDKNLKAIAVYGTKDINIARPEPFYELCQEILDRSYDVVKYIDDEQHDASHGRRQQGTYYRNTDLLKKWPEAGRAHMDFLSRRGAVKIGCYNCSQKCFRSVPFADGEPVYLKCRSPFYFINMADFQNYDFNLQCNYLIQRYGLDALSPGNICAFAIDLYQKGILTKEDTDGMHLEWGKPEIIFALLEKIGRREGIGDVLANGVYQAAQQIGRGAEQYANHVRKLETRGMNMHQVNMASAYILCDRMDNTRFGGGGFGEAEEVGKDIAEAVHRTYPPEWKEYLDLPNAGYCVSDCLGLCIFWTGFKPFTPIRKWDMPELISYATGVEMSHEDMEKGFRRARALIRAYNTILGERMRADDLPGKFFNGVGPIPPISRDELSKRVAYGNELMGYTAEGIPTRESLEEIGLGDIAQELARRGLSPKPSLMPVT
ncbi:MAG: hypothetical protein HYY41_03425 [Chloroflexi bacterium]|nr:hypothetical protein [Chloroflexota bacterium]MBI2979860.1 hypothetical protein [Chloroflexota bacterium]